MKISQLLSIGIILLAASANAQTIGTWSLARNNFGFADHLSFDDARAAIALAFPQSTYLRLDTLTAQGLQGVDILILSSRAEGEGGSVPLSQSESTALADFIQDGGTLFAHVPSLYGSVSQSYLTPFNLELAPPVLNGSIVDHSLVQIVDPIIDGEFGVATLFQNRFESHVRGINSSSVEDQGAIALASTIHGATLVLVPRGVAGGGQAVFFTNFFAYHNSDFSSSRGLFGGANDNDVFLLNLIASSVRESDADGDGIPDGDDNCPNTANADQIDTDGDGVGDVCDSDLDGDGVSNDLDNCIFTANGDQSDFDQDGVGDVCDPDVDGDGVANESDFCPFSITSTTVVIDGCDSGVGNILNVDGQGCSLADLLSECTGAKNHGKYVSCVAGILNILKKERIISGREKGAIMRCAAQADLP